MELVLQVLTEDGDVEREVVVGGERFSLGRDEGNDLHLQDVKASRWHAAIERADEGWVIVDLGSANRTRVDDEPISRQRLADGQTILLGKSSVRAVFRGQATVEAPPPAVDASAVAAVEASSKTPTVAARASTLRVDRAHRRLRTFLLGTVLAFALGVLAGRLTSEPHEPSAPASPAAGPVAAAVGMEPGQVVSLEERLLAEARVLRERGQLAGAYGVLHILRAAGEEGSGDRLQATLDALATATLAQALAKSAAARDIGDLDGARRALSAAASALAGTPLAADAQRELAAVEGLQGLLTARVEDAASPADPAAGRTVATDPRDGAGAGDRGPDTAAPGSVPPAAGDEAGGASTATVDRVTRAEGELAREHLLSLLRRQRVAAAVDSAARLAARLSTTSRPGPRLEDWPDDLHWLVTSMPWEGRLREALLAAANTRADDERLQLDLRGIRARVIGADAEGLTLAVGESGAGRQSWERVSAVHYVTLLAQLEPELGTDLVQVAGAWARRGLPRPGFDLLEELHERGGEWVAAVETALAGWQGLDAVPEGGYLSFRGDLVAIAEKERILEEERAAEKEHRRELARLSATSPQNLPRTLVAYARRLFALGSFERGHKVLRLVVSEYPRHEIVRSIQAQAQPNAILHSEITHSWPRVLPGEPAPPNRVDILVCGDGYLLSDRRQRSYSKAADRVIEGILDHEPFLEYASYVVCRKVYGISEDKRVSTEYEKRSTLFEGFRPRMGGQVEINWRKTRGLLDDAFPDAWDTALVMVRQGSLGKGMMFGDLCAFQEGAVQIAFHEMGHSFVDLLDEYSINPYGGKPLRGPVPTGYNLVNSTDLQNCPWRHWIEAGEPGIGFHEGGAGRPKGAWHPSARGCVMNQGIDFCPVCREQAVLRIYEHVRPIERVEPATDEVIELDRPLGDPEDHASGVTLRVSVLKPATHSLDVTWTINGERPTYGRTIPYRDPRSGEWIVEARLPYAAFREGETPNRVVASVSDPTPWVLADPRGLLKQEVSWEVVALPAEALTTPESGGK